MRHSAASGSTAIGANAQPVLVVDDDPLVGARICQALRDQGLEVWLVDDPRRLIEATVLHAAQTVVVDQIVDEVVDMHVVSAMLGPDVQLILLRYDPTPHPVARVFGGPMWFEQLIEHFSLDAALSA